MPLWPVIYKKKRGTRWLITISILQPTLSADWPGAFTRSIERRLLPSLRPPRTTNASDLLLKDDMPKPAGSTRGPTLSTRVIAPIGLTDYREYRLEVWRQIEKHIRSSKPTPGSLGSVPWTGVPRVGRAWQDQQVPYAIRLFASRCWALSTTLTLPRRAGDIKQKSLRCRGQLPRDPRRRMIAKSRIVRFHHG